MTSGELVISTLAAALAVCWMSGCRPAVTEAEAAKLAAQRVDDYAEGEGLDPSAFGKPIISSEPGHPWVFDYTSDTMPSHLLRIYVNSRDDVEIHRMIEEQPSPTGKRNHGLGDVVGEPSSARS
jgi:hypothetical protein